MKHILSTLLTAVCLLAGAQQHCPAQPIGYDTGGCAVDGRIGFTERIDGEWTNDTTWYEFIFTQHYNDQLVVTFGSDSLDYAFSYTQWGDELDLSTETSPIDAGFSNRPVRGFDPDNGELFFTATAGTFDHLHKVLFDPITVYRYGLYEYQDAFMHYDLFELRSYIENDCSDETTTVYITDTVYVDVLVTDTVYIEIPADSAFCIQYLEEACEQCWQDGFDYAANNCDDSCPADLNNDNLISTADLLMFLGVFSLSCDELD